MFYNKKKFYLENYLLRWETFRRIFILFIFFWPQIDKRKTIFFSLLYPLKFIDEIWKMHAAAA